MDYLSRPISEIHEALIKGEVSPYDLVKDAIEKARTDNNNAFEYICEKEAYEQIRKLDKNKKENLLWGIPFVLKDNYSTKDIPTTGSSNVLNGYVPVFSSEVYLRLLEQGAILIGKTTLDELGMGGTGKSGRLGCTYNPWDPSHKHQIGGSSCGSAAAVCSGIVPFGIGSDTGDSVRKPASYGGMVGFKPTWGRISRFGLFPFAPSLDHVAYFTRNVYDSAIILNALAGHDEKDNTSSLHEVEQYLDFKNVDLRNKKVAIIDEIIESINDKEIIDAFNKSLDGLIKAGVIVNHVHMDKNLLKAIFPTYIVISSAEATSNNANLDGIKFGPRYEGEDYESVVIKARTKGFSEPIKRRFVIGSYCLMRENQEELLLRAQRSRRLIVNAINKILEENDAIYAPASPTTAPFFDGVKQDKLSDEYLIADNYLAFANFAGLPSLTLPLGIKNGLPFGANITGKLFEEKNVFSLAYKLEQYIGLKDLIAGKEK